MTKPYRIVIAEDYTLLREGLRALIESDSRFQVVDEAEDGWQAVQSVQKHAPDLLLIDLNMPRMNGIDAIREINREQADTRILALTVHKSEEYLRAALEAGANGYALKDATRDQLLMAVDKVLAGESHLCPGVTKKVIAGYLDGRQKAEAKTSWDLLTRREREVLTAIAEGNKNREIADRMFISVKTVAKHRANLMKKLDLHNTAELTAYAIDEGLVIK